MYCSRVPTRPLALIPFLVSPDVDVSLNAPDEQSIITYVSQFLEHFPGLEEVGLPLGSDPKGLVAADRFLGFFFSSLRLPCSLSRKSPCR